MVIDGDGHCNEPRDLFDRYLEKDFRDRGPRVVDAGGLRWMIEGKFPRVQAKRRIADIERLFFAE